MPRYHFHIFDGRDQRDEDGIELPDFQTAQVEAIRFAGELLKDRAHHIALSEEWRMEVTDENNLILLRLDFAAVPSPAASHGSRLAADLSRSPEAGRVFQ